MICAFKGWDHSHVARECLLIEKPKWDVVYIIHWQATEVSMVETKGATISYLGS